MNTEQAPRQHVEPSPQSALLEIIGGAWAARAVAVAAELSLADALEAGPAGATELAARLGVRVEPLRQLLRALATLEIVAERSDGTFELLERGRLLRSGGPDSLRAWAIWAGSACWAMWGRLDRAVRTGQGARAAVHGRPGFEHLGSDPELAAVFNEAMVSLTALAAPGIVRAVDWSSDRLVADVGGGHGALLAEALVMNPGLRGLLFDLPHAMDGARAYLGGRGVLSRCELHAGDFFSSVPAGATTYLLKTVLHDWDDARACQILRSCRAAMSGSARLLIVERLMPERMEAKPLHRALARSDLHMLAAHGAGERTEAQFRALASAAGLAVRSVRSGGGVYSVLEAVGV
ncbi:MAG: hypothetical protein JNJ48_01590 [Phycisphaerae bacterium]|nr:hypothetical protein [Phycisphaerae bacterium]